MNTSLPLIELRHWLALWRVYGIGPIHFAKLLEIFPKLEELFNTSAKQLAALGLSENIISAIKNPDWQHVEQDLHWATLPNNHIVTSYDPHYPHLLKHIDSPPPILFLQGDPALLQTHQLAIVGSRNPTHTGKETAYQFAQHLCAAGLAITSGLALGIDAASHRGAIDAQGKTIAVLGSGLDCIYPASHKKLAQEIAEKGALISEYPLDTPPKAQYFPRRNRLVCGMSLGVLVVEATLRSGSLITARLAAEQGREVFAIPGSIHNSVARGCHFLIRQGAKLVETAQDIIEELSALATVEPEQKPPAITPSLTPHINHSPRGDNHAKLLAAIGFETTTVDQLAERTGFNVQTVSSMLLILEMEEMITSVAGGYQKLAV